MAYFVVCTFDLKNASREDYENAYTDLASLGLKKTVVSKQGTTVVAPTTMTMGEFTGDSSTQVRDWVREKIRVAFAARGFSSEIFVLVAGDWAWGGSST